jgi:hypothetical protein
MSTAGEIVPICYGLLPTDLWLLKKIRRIINIVLDYGKRTYLVGSCRYVVGLTQDIGFITINSFYIWVWQIL